MGELMHWPLSITARLAHQQETIFELTDGLSELQLKSRLNPEKWSGFENMVHLAAYQPLFLNRMELILTLNEPTFDRYTAEQDPLFYEYLKLSFQELKDRITAQRNTIIKKLSAFSEPEMIRKGLHPKFGWMTVIQWTEFFLLHEAHHIYTIFMLTQELRKQG